MAKKRRVFKRRVPIFNYRKLFIIATEGVKTEPAYFGMFNNQKTMIRVKLLPSKHRTSPPQVLKRAKDYVTQERMKKGDEVWLVIDRDQWTEDQLADVFMGCRIFDFNLAVSNPKFEYWLLLHFEDGNDVNSSRDCSHRLRKHLPNYDKVNLEISKIAPGIADAIQRASAKDFPPCERWPETNSSTVYRLVQKLN